MYFFFQMIGIDSEFCIVGSLVTGFNDMWPDYLRARRKQFTKETCILLLSSLWLPTAELMSFRLDIFIKF